MLPVYSVTHAPGLYHPALSLRGRGAEGEEEDPHLVLSLRGRGVEGEEEEDPHLVLFLRRRVVEGKRQPSRRPAVS